VRIDGIWYGFGGPVWYFDGAWRHFVVLIVVFDAPICGDGNDNRNSNPQRQRQLQRRIQGSFATLRMTTAWWVGVSGLVGWWVKVGAS
jgi:hypothetical protein